MPTKSHRNDPFAILTLMTEILYGALDRILD